MLIRKVTAANLQGQTLVRCPKGNNKKVSGLTENNKSSWKSNNKNKMECYTEGKNNNKMENNNNKNNKD